MAKRMIEMDMDVAVTYRRKDGFVEHDSYDWEDLKLNGLNFNEIISDYFAEGATHVEVTITRYDV